MLPLSETAIRKAISELGMPDVGRLRVVSSQERTYSQVHFVELSSEETTRKFVLKIEEDGSSRGVNLANLANRKFADAAGIFQPRCVLIDGGHAVLSEFFAGDPFASRTKFRLDQGPFVWIRNLDEISQRAINWLSDFHAIQSDWGDVSGPLMKYIENRVVVLDALSEDLRTDFIRICSGPIETKCVLSHGDFTPHNILLDDAQLCVVDFGIDEWEMMSPMWDFACFIVGMQRSCLFSWSNPMRWMPWLFNMIDENACSTFSVNSQDPLLKLCLAIRHFTCLAPFDGDKMPTASEVSRQRWHLKKFRAAILALQDFRDRSVVI